MLALLMPLFIFAEPYADTLEYKIEGKITYKSGTTVKIQKSSGEDMPKTGTEGELSKYFETEMFGGKMSGWMSIGQMKVTAVSGDIVTFTLLKELSVVTENGVKKNHFEIGKEVKFVWKVAVSADEAAYQKGQDVVNDDVEQAMVFYRQALAVNPDHHKSLNMMGMIYDFKQNRDSALYFFRKASETAPKELLYARNVLITAYRLNQYTLAYTYACKALELDLKDPELWYYRALTLYMSKEGNFTEEDKAKILADMAKSIELAPDDPSYYSERAYVRDVFGDAAGACQDAKKAKELGMEGGEDAVLKYCAE